MTPNLAEWIGFIDFKGVKPFPIGNLRRRWDRAKQVGEKKRPHDSMRHSYASYHFAMFGNASLIAKNLGYQNSTLFKKDYNKLYLGLRLVNSGLSMLKIFQGTIPVII